MGKEFGVESTVLADIFDLQRHLFRIYFDKLCVYPDIGRQVGVMVRHVSTLNYRAVGPGPLSIKLLCSACDVLVV